MELLPNSLNVTSYGINSHIEGGVDGLNSGLIINLHELHAQF